MQSLDPRGPSIRVSPNAGHYFLKHEDQSTMRRQNPVIAISNSQIDTNRAFYAELEVVSIGSYSSYAAAIGVGPRYYPSRRAPGWDRGSLAYHSDDGKIFAGHGVGTSYNFPITRPGDTVGLLVCNKKVYFTHNGTLLNNEHPFTCPHIPCHLFIGMNHYGESSIVKLQPPFICQPEALVSSICGSSNLADLGLPSAPPSKVENYRNFMVGGTQPDDLRCPICLDVLQDAIEASCCHSLFCQDCAVVDKCPSCRSSFKSSANHPIRRMVAGLATTCSLCNYNTTRGEFAVHFRRCPKRARSCKMCSKPVSIAEMGSHLAEAHLDVLDKYFC
ncbi:hypothetical protein P9112_006888 [Eukaryota sp. TZLM1-RC]